MKTKILLLLALILCTALSAVNPAAARDTNEGFQQNQGQNLETNTVKVFPNPVTSNSFFVQAQKNIDDVKVVNILGQKAETILSRKNTNFTEVTFLNKKQGVYLVTIFFDDKTSSVVRIVVK